jgi:hypothetical protein
MKTADFGPYPLNQEELIKQWSLTNLKDPESVRYSTFSKPRKEYIIENYNPVYGFSVCVGINAKNSYGGYTGTTVFWFFIRDSKLVRVKNTTEKYIGEIISVGHKCNCEDGNQVGD